MSTSTVILTRHQIESDLAEIVEHDEWAKRGAPLVRALLDAQSLRISELSHHMDGQPEANRKHIERLLHDYDPRESLKRLYWDDAPYQLIDPTEIERNQAYNTPYVGELSNGRRGFWILPAVTPFRGRALPFDFRTYSARTIEDHPEESRNLQHRRLIWDIYCDKPVVMDREFSYAGLLEDMVELGMEFVVRLNNASGVHITLAKNDSSRRVSLNLPKNDKRVYRHVYYKETIPVNLIGIWHKEEKEPLWVMSNLEPERALNIYLDRMKIEESFKDLKSLLHMDRVMNKRRDYMERLVAWALIAYAIGFVVGEFLRDEQYRGKKKEVGELFWTLHPPAPEENDLEEQSQTGPASREEILR
jgi:hypothetical protein